MGTINKPMPIFKETKYVFMTPDRKCIVCGANKWHLQLKLVEEKSRYKVKHCKNAAEVLYTVKRTAKHNGLQMTDKVKELYHTDEKYYKEELFGELIKVKVEADYFLLD